MTGLGEDWLFSIKKPFDEDEELSLFVIFPNEWAGFSTLALDVKSKRVAGRHWASSLSPGRMTG